MPKAEILSPGKNVDFSSRCGVRGLLAVATAYIISNKATVMFAEILRNLKAAVFS
jgi:hypothetical protein